MKVFSAGRSGVTALVLAAGLLQGCTDSYYSPWLDERLTEEYTQQQAAEVRSFEDYLALEERLFKELDANPWEESCCCTACRIRPTVCVPLARHSTLGATRLSDCVCQAMGRRPQGSSMPSGKTWRVQCGSPCGISSRGWEAGRCTSSAIPSVVHWQ